MSCGIDCGWSRPGSTPSPNSIQNRNALLASRVPASVRQRLLTLSQRRKVKPFDLVLVRYSIKWLFARLSR